MIKDFDGKLTAEELKRLREALVSEKEIRKIEDFLEKYKSQLSGFVDIVGDDFIPSKLFPFNMKHLGKLLDSDVDKVLGKTSLKLRHMTIGKLIKKLGYKFMSSDQVFENRNELRNPNDTTPDKGIILPNEPVLWTPNHHFKDDALASIVAAKRPLCLLFGSIPLYFNTSDGILAYLVGSILVNRKSSESKKASVAKLERAIDFGSDVLYYPEGVWCKSPNNYLLDFWNGVYRVANEKGIKVVPMVHYIKDATQKIPKEINPIHTVIDDPIDLTKFTEKEGLSYLRDVIATWYHLMMEKYGKMTRDELMEFYKQRAILNGAKEEDLENGFTSHDAYEIYLKDLLTTVTGYDSSIEAGPADFRPKDKVRPEDVFENIAKASITPENCGDVLYAQKLVKQRKLEDYQRRF